MPEKDNVTINAMVGEDQAGVLDDHSDHLTGVGVEGPQSHLPKIFQRRMSCQLNITSSSSGICVSSSSLLSQQISSDPFKVSSPDLDGLLWSRKAWLEVCDLRVEVAGRVEEFQQ